MKLRKLFTAAISTAALSLSLSFTANAELIKQSFDITFDGGSATIEIEADTTNTLDFFDDEFYWIDDEINYFSVTGLTYTGAPAPLDFMFSGADMFTAFNYFDASAYVNSASGSGNLNGFFAIEFELNLEAIDNLLDGVVEVALFNDIFGIGGFFDGFEDTAGGFGSLIASTPKSVAVSAPTTALIMFVSIAGLGFARRK
jgi:hypothetical protein